MFDRLCPFSLSPSAFSMGHVTSIFPLTEKELSTCIKSIPCTLTFFRYYIQPQWLYDCVNAKILLPVEDYFLGVTLPPHLSPFVEEKDGDYVPPEKLKIMALQRGEKPGMTNSRVCPMSRPRNEHKKTPFTYFTQAFSCFYCFFYNTDSHDRILGVCVFSLQTMVTPWVHTRDCYSLNCLSSKKELVAPINYVRHSRSILFDMLFIIITQLIHKDLILKNNFYWLELQESKHLA